MRCPFCSSETRSLMHLLQHFYSKHPPASQLVPRRRSRISGGFDFALLMRFVEEWLWAEEPCPPRIICLRCGGFFKTASAFLIHSEKIHCVPAGALVASSSRDTLGEVVCPVCGKLLPKAALLYHVSLVHGASKLLPPLRNSRRDYFLALKVALQVRRIDGDLAVVCPRCSNFFSSYADLRRHAFAAHRTAVHYLFKSTEDHQISLATRNPANTEHLAPQAKTP